MASTKKLLICAFIILSLALIAGLFPVHGESEVYDNVLRLHVIANSDSEHDQSVKLFVRDRVLEELRILLADAEEQTDAVAVIEKNLEYLRGVCNETLEALGEEIGVVIRCQHEDIFNMMHRI